MIISSCCRYRLPPMLVIELKDVSGRTAPFPPPWMLPGAERRASTASAAPSEASFALLAANPRFPPRSRLAIGLWHRVDQCDAIENGYSTRAEERGLSTWRSGCGSSAGGSASQRRTSAAELGPLAQ